MKAIFYTFLLISCCSCEKEVTLEKIFSNLVLTPAELQADGQSKIWVSVEIDNAANEDRRNFIFSTTAGTFTKTKTDHVTVKAEYENGVLMAKSELQASTSPGEFTVSVQPEFDSSISDFKLSKTGKTTESSPASIDLETSAFGIVANFGSEVLLTATLKNGTQRNVSKGVQVIFEDELLNTDKALGRFRKLQKATADSSKVTTYYAVPAYPIGTTIKVRSTVLTADGAKTMIKDSVLITINQ
jgi:hypothetical protein